MGARALSLSLVPISLPGERGLFLGHSYRFQGVFHAHLNAFHVLSPVLFQQAISFSKSQNLERGATYSGVRRVVAPRISSR